MKHYQKMIELGCFSRGSLAKALGCGDATAATVLQQYLKKGYIERVRHDCYVVISIETNQPLLSRYEIACRLFEDACVAYHSALEVFGFANQVYYETYVMSAHRFSDFTYNGITFRRVLPSGKFDCQWVGNIRTTNLEQTVIDSIYALDQRTGLEEFLRCLLLIPSLKSEKLLFSLSCYGNGYLYQKAGYLLEALNESLMLPEQFFFECQAHISEAKRYLTKKHENYVYNDKWRLYTPRSLMEIIDKGVDHDVSI